MNMQNNPSNKEAKSTLAALGILAIFLAIFAALAWAFMDASLGLSFLVIVGGGELIGALMMFIWNRIPRSTADKIPGWVPRLFLALVFILPCVALGSITAHLDSQKNKPYSDVIDAVAPLCNGQKIMNASAYSQAGIHPVVLIDEQDRRGYIHKDSYPSGWFPQAAADTQVVVCIADQTTKIETCPYSSDNLSSLNVPSNYLEIYQHVLSVSVYEAGTGRNIDTFELYGAKLECPIRREFKNTTERETGANLSNDELFSRLEQFVK
jgi:hypothetical protein